MKIISISDMDVLHLKLLRANINKFLASCSQQYDKEGLLLLDIAPQIYKGAKEFFSKSKVLVLDINKDSGADYIADLCNNNTELIPSDYFDIIICTEVLEHTLNPFEAVREMRRLVKQGGIVCVSVPFNFRIHGPLPDCWRFTEHGLRYLFKEYELISLESLNTETRDLMPIQYTLIAKK